MRTKRNRAKRRGSEFVPPAPPQRPLAARRTRRQMQPDLAEIEHKAFMDTRQADYDAPDDVLAPLMRERILAQHPEINHKRDSYLTFWTRAANLEPNQDDAEAAQSVRRAIRKRQREQRGR